MEKFSGFQREREAEVGLKWAFQMLCCLKTIQKNGKYKSKKNVKQGQGQH